MISLELPIAAAMIIGGIVSSSYGLDKGIGEEFSVAARNLTNLNLLMRLAQTGKAPLKASTATSEDSQKEIAARIETNHAVIYAYKEVEIPDFLSFDFDRVFEMVAGYFNLEVKNEKMVVWVGDFDTLQEMYRGQKAYPGGSPNTVAALMHIKSPFVALESTESV